MTVREYIDYISTEQELIAGDPDKLFTQDAMTLMQTWSNQAVIGYAVDAGKNIGLTENQLNDLFFALSKSLDKLTIIEAENLCADTFF